MKQVSLFLIFVCCALTLAVAGGVGENVYCAKGDVPLGSKSDAVATLPLRCVNTNLQNTPSPGTTTIVPAGADINAYLAAAACGDTILLSPGLYKPFILPAKTCDAAHWINIRSAAAGFPGSGVRVTPCYAGLASLPGRPKYNCPKPVALMATISTKPGPVIRAAVGANYYRIGPGIELTRPDIKGISYTLVELLGADHIIFDRVWAHGSELPYETKGGFDLTGATNVAIVNSYLNNFKCIAGIGGSCTDAHAIGGGDDPENVPQGPWKIYNNFIEASGENILFGGAGRGATTPADIEIRLNHLYKVPAWNRDDPAYVQPYDGFRGYIVKNIFELKNAERVLFEGNRLEYSWGGYSQKGFAILLTPRGEWAKVEDITIRYNYISHVGSGFQLKATRSCTASDTDPTQCKDGSGTVMDSKGAARWNLHDILVDDVNAAYYLGGGSMASIGSDYRNATPLSDLVLDHITFITNGQDGDIMIIGSSPENPQPQMGTFKFTNSIVRAGEYNGIWDPGPSLECAENGQPIPTFEQCFTGHDVGRNLIVGWGSERKAGPWPGDNQTPVDYSTVFVDPQLSGGDYRVLPPYSNAGRDGKDLGADINTIMTFMAKAAR